MTRKRKTKKEVSPERENEARIADTAVKKRAKTALRAEGKKPAQVTVVGMGASAGGLSAFKKFFAAMPQGSGIAFVLVPHLDPRHESLMVELIARHTQMPVVEATEGIRVRANHVYILPPNKYMTIKGGVLRLTGPVERHGLQTSIDLFLRSLAEDQQERAICIILSGTGSHGTLGLRAIKAGGGVTMVQDPKTAEYDRMPQSAVATGLADYVLPAEQMPEALIKFVQHFYSDGAKPTDVVAEASDHLNQLLALLRTRARFDFRCYRKKMLLRRIERRMGLKHIRQITDYLAYLRDHPEEVKQLVRDLLISVTSFFRDAEAYRALQMGVGPLVQGKEPDAPLRVWVPSCATGEEPYSIGILLLEQLAASQKSCPLQIFATDVDDSALEVARQGIYPDSISADVSAERLERFFTRVDEAAYQVNKQLREAVVFAAQNLIVDAPFSKLDLISCRNVLIYLEPEIQKNVIDLLHFALSEGGYLILGPSETIGRQTDLFEPVSKKWRIYRRIGPARAEGVEIPIAAKGALPSAAVSALPRPGAPLSRAPDLAEVTQQLLLEEFAAAAVLINRKHEILYFFGPTTRYLDQPAGAPTHDLMLLAREGLRSNLRVAVHKAIREGQAVHAPHVQIKRNGAYQSVKVTVKPVQIPKTAAGTLLVIFQDVAETQQPVQDSGTDDALARLELDLKATREDLQSTIEELESSNEELKASNEEVMSMNEELQSANEELESSKEELQSLNEELITVNSQLQEKVVELETASNDMANLLNCTDIGTVFLDTRYRIKQFTPVATKLFNLIASDVGRPISDIAQKFTDTDLLRDAELVLRDLLPREKEIQTEDNRWCIRRTVPYRSVDNRIEGVVITFADVTQLRRASEGARRLATVLIDSSDGILVHDFQGRLTAWNRGAERMYGYSEAEALQMNIDQLIPEELRDEEHANWARLRAGERIDSWETQRVTKDGRVLDIWLTSTTLNDDAGRPVAIAKTHRDITQTKRTRASLEREVERRTAALREQQERLRAILDAPSDAIITIDQRGIIESVNAAAERMFGYTAAEMIDQNIGMLMPAPFRDEHDSYLANYLQTGIKKIIGIGREVTALRKDGTRFPADLAVNEVSHLKLFTGILRDISRRKQLEKEVLEIAALEQRRIGQDLHDSVGQEMTAVGLLAQELVVSLQEQYPSEAELAGRIATSIGRALENLRAINRGIIPVEVDSRGLMAALADLAMRVQEQSRGVCTFHCPEPVDIEDNTVATHVFCIAREAVANAVKHGRPQNIRISLVAHGKRIILQVHDDGRGMPRQTAANQGLGLRIMQNRASVIDASLTIQHAAPSGTMVTCAFDKRNDHGPTHTQGQQAR